MDETPNQRKEREQSDARRFEVWLNDTLNLATWYQLCELSVFPVRRLLSHYGYGITVQQALSMKAAARKRIEQRWEEDVYEAEDDSVPFSAAAMGEPDCAWDKADREP